MYTFHKGIITIFLWILTFGLTNTSVQIGKEACLHIYTVPKSSVVCEPTQEIRNELDYVKLKLSEHSTDIDILMGYLNGKVDIEKPPKLKDFKEKITRNVTKIQDYVSNNWAKRYLLRLQSEVESIRMKILHFQDVHSLIEMQGNLMKMMTSHTNFSALQVDIKELTMKLHDLNKGLLRSELDLTKKFHDSETRLMDLIISYHQNEVTNSNKLTEVTHNLHVWEEIITNDSRRISMLENNTKITEKNIPKYTGGDENVGYPNSVKELQRKNEKLEERTSELEKIVAEMQNQMLELRKEIHLPPNHTENLTSTSAPSNITELSTIVPQPVTRVSDCQDIRTVGHNESGVYSVYPKTAAKPFDVFCELPPDGTGWTIIQRRYHGNVDFYRGWSQYSEGFGKIEGEFWLGLENIYYIINSRSNALQVDMQAFSGKWYFAFYANFSISSQEDRYRLHVFGYHGNAGDALAYHNGMPFSTFDIEGPQGKCARLAHGAWWYNNCHSSNLNGRYYDNDNFWTSDGIVWKKTNDINYKPFKSIIMKIRPI